MTLLAKLRSLFSGRPAASSRSDQNPNQLAQTPRRAAEIQIRDGWLEVKGLSFFGQAHSSPSGRWVLGCADNDGQGKGGCRESGNGRMLLVDMAAGNIAHDIQNIARPWNAAVADTGTYVVNDAGFGSALSGDVLVFNQAGARLYERKFAANVFSVGISHCGRFIAVQTCNAPSGSDGNLLEVHDVQEGACLSSASPQTVWSLKYDFEVEDGNLKQLWVYDDRLGRFAYSNSGVFLDHRKYLDAALTKGDIGTRILAAESLLEAPEGSSDIETALRVVSEAANGAKESEQSWVPKALRLRGEALESLGRTSEAMAAYKTALAKDPKIGVKRRLAALQRRQTKL